MSIRETIGELFAKRGADVDADQALNEAGFGDISSEELGEALVHYADSAPLAEADALAPVVTLTSTVPFTDDDLAPSTAADTDDVFSRLGQAISDAEIDYGESQLDQTERVDGSDVLEMTDVDPNADSSDEPDFGADEPEQADIEPTEPDVVEPDEPFDGAPSDVTDEVDFGFDLDLIDDHSARLADDDTAFAAEQEEIDDAEDVDVDLDFEG